MKKLLLILFYSSISLFAMSQGIRKTITIKGALIDSATNTPLSFVPVSLTNAANNQPVKSMLVKDDGSFELEGLTARPYKLTIATIGYQTKIINISGKDVVTDLGKIIISPSSSGLKEVTVTADRPIIKQEIDRISYDIQADPENKVMNVLDMLRKVPLLSLDADDNILLKGGGDYKILINGKPSSLVARNPTDIFRAMPASSIQKIEVITTPPAKYDSDGLAGIINIITVQKIDNGYNGSFNLNYRTPVGGPGAGGSLTVKQGKFGVSAFYGGNYRQQPETTNSNSRITTIDNSNLNQNGRRKSSSHNGYLGTEFSFEIDTLNLLTAEFNINGGNSNSDSYQSSLRTTGGATSLAYDIGNMGNGKYNGYDIGLNYQKGFKDNKNKTLTFSYKYTVADNSQFNNQTISNRVNFSDPNYKQNNNETSKQHIAQLDYAQTVKMLNIEAGFKGIMRNGDTNFEFDTLLTNADPTIMEYGINQNRTNIYINNRYIIGAYNSYQYNLATWGFKVGGRLEETITNANSISANQQINQHVFNIIPSVSINKKFNNMSSLNFGFTQRIQRPNIANLNPFVDRVNPNFVNAGNPNLKQVLSNSFQVNYSRFKKGSINIGLSYNTANGTVQQLSVYDPTTGITRSTFENVGKNRSLSSHFNVNYPITNLWNFNLNGNLSYLWLEGEVNNVLTKNSGLQGYFNANTGYKIMQGWRVNANFNFNSPYISLQGKSNAFLYTGFSTSKEIVKNKLTASVSVSNPFNKYRTNIRTTKGLDSDGNTAFTQASYSQSYLRVYAFSLHYRFGKLKDAIRRNDRNINEYDIIKPVPPPNTQPLSPPTSPPPSVPSNNSSPTTNPVLPPNGRPAQK